MDSRLISIDISTSKVITLLVCLSVFGCSPEDVTFDTTPRIEFESVEVLKNIQGKDSSIELSIYFEDGDGDVGLGPTDTMPPFNFGSPNFHNLPITYLVKDTNGYSELINPINSMPYGNGHERLPVLTPTGKNKAINGTVKVSLPANPVLSNPEEIKFEIQLVDRALNRSNVLESPAIELVH